VLEEGERERQDGTEGVRSLRVFFFEQNGQASTCQTLQRRELRRSGATPRSGSHIGSLSSVPSRLPQTLASQLIRRNSMSLETILIIVLVVFLLGGGGWFWQRGRG
jgi:hypothetical protein